MKLPKGLFGSEMMFKRIRIKKFKGSQISRAL